MAITYTPNNFSGKDAVNAVLTGVDFDVEFAAISTAFGSAAPTAAPTFSGTATFYVVSTSGDVTIGGNLTVAGRVVEDTVVNAAVSGSVSIGTDAASIYYHTSSGSTTYTDGLVEGQSVTLMLKPGAQTITWPAGIKWVGGFAPDLDNNNFNVISLWKANNILFGSWGGSVDVA